MQMLFSRALIVDTDIELQSSQECFIHRLPTDIWIEITPYLDVYSLKSLWKSRDKRISNILQNGAIWYISKHTCGFNDPIAWPKSILKQFPQITHLIVSGRWNYPDYERFLSLEQIKRLPPGLLHLELSNYQTPYRFLRNAKEHFCKVIASLPQTLEHFGCPFPIDSVSIPYLPKSLTSLRCNDSAIDEEAWLVLPPRLKHFKTVRSRAFSQELTSVIPDMVTLSIILPKNSYTTFYSNILSRFPRTLTHLEFNGIIKILIDHLSLYLPPHLRVLRIKNTTLEETIGTETIHYEFHDYDGKPLLFPPELRVLAVRSMPLKLCIPLLPSNLDTFELFDASYFENLMLTQLPPYLTKLTLKNAQWINSIGISKLSKHLISLTLSSADTIHLPITILPPSLTHFKSMNTEFDAESLKRAPPLLRSLEFDTSYQFPSLALMILPNDPSDNILLNYAREMAFMDFRDWRTQLFNVIYYGVIAQRIMMFLPLVPPIISQCSSKIRASIFSMALAVLSLFS